MRFLRFTLIVGTLWLGACSPTAPDALANKPPDTPEFTSATPAITAALTPIHNPDVGATLTPNVSLVPATGPRQLVIGMAPSPDGQLLAVVDDRGAQMHRVGDFEVLWRAPLEGMSTNLRENEVQIVWTDDSQTVTISVSHHIYDLSVTLAFVTYLSRFDALTGELCWQRTFPEKPNVWFAPDGDHVLLMSMYNDGVEIWDGATHTQTGTLELPERGNVWWLLDHNWSPDESMIAGTVGITGEITAMPGGGLSNDLVYYGKIHVWDSVTGKLIAIMSHPHQWPNSQKYVGWLPDGSRLFSAEKDCFIFWDAGTWQYRYEIYYDPAYNAANPILSPDGSRLLAFLYFVTADPRTIEPSFGWWGVTSMQELEVDPMLQQALEEEHYATVLGWMPDGRTLVFTVGYRLMTFNVQNGEVTELYVLPSPDTTAWRSDPIGGYYLLSLDGKYVYGLEPTAVAVYDTHTGEVLQWLED